MQVLKNRTNEEDKNPELLNTCSIEKCLSFSDSTPLTMHLWYRDRSLDHPPDMSSAREKGKKKKKARKQDQRTCGKSTKCSDWPVPGPGVPAWEELRVMMTNLDTSMNMLVIS